MDVSVVVVAVVVTALIVGLSCVVSVVALMLSLLSAQIGYLHLCKASLCVPFPPVPAVGWHSLGPVCKGVEYTVLSR